VDPHPVSDHDPFSLGDSDEELEAKKDVKTEEAKKDSGSAAATSATETTEATKPDVKGSSS
jgi:hypothetical protein